MSADRLGMSRAHAGGSDDLRGHAAAWWASLPDALRAPWPVALAVATILALLIGFHQVVKESVRQGELLRMSTATRAEAVWRCNALNSVRKRADCLAQIDAPQRQQASADPPPNTAVLPKAGG
ncbi:MAG TPA: hypothetical protein VGE16_02715 [Albitalea sp.]